MLKLYIPGVEMFDNDKQEFITPEGTTIELEHSLVSLSKWEAIWEKPFMGPAEKSTEETLGYVQAMCITPEVPPETFLSLTNEHLEQVNTYINAKMSATWFTEVPGARRGPASREIITSEVIYYWMFSAQIPLECEHWHLNRLMTLLKVFSEKNNSGGKKMNKNDAAAQRRMLNEQRKAKLNTTG